MFKVNEYRMEHTTGVVSVKASAKGRWSVIDLPNVRGSEQSFLFRTFDTPEECMEYAMEHVDQIIHED